MYLYIKKTKKQGKGVESDRWNGQGRFLEEMTFDLNEVKVRVMVISGRRAFKAEDATRAKALRQKQAWHVPGTVRR